MDLGNNEIVPVPTQEQDGTQQPLPEHPMPDAAGAGPLTQLADYAAEESQRQQQAEGNKRQREAEDPSAGADSSGAATNSQSIYLESRSKAMQQFEADAAAAVQPAVSLVFKRQDQFAKLENRHAMFQQQQEQGKIPGFIRACSKQLVPQHVLEKFDSTDAYKTAVKEIAAAEKQYLSSLHAAVTKLTQAEKEEAAKLNAAAELEAQIILQKPFNGLPVTWITKPEVQRINREQQEDYIFNLNAALKNATKTAQQKAKQQAEQQATAEAEQVETGAVSIEQQVQAAVNKLLKPAQDRISKLEKQLAAQQQGKSKSSTPAAAAAATAGKSTAAATTPKGGRDHSRSISRGRSRSRKSRSPPARSSSAKGRNHAVSFADAVKVKGKQQQQRGKAVAAAGRQATA